uniref:Uncharacterized protein n=1 Tax=Pinguiococcus pyrenoidosus TaxID=172671 RepID=A0A7R9U6Y5_9STRA
MSRALRGGWRRLQGVRGLECLGARAVLRRMSNSPKGGEDTRGGMTLSEIFDYYNVFQQQVSEDVFAKDLGFFQNHLLFAKLLYSDDIRAIDWKDFVRGAKQAYSQVFKSMQSRDVVVHAVLHVSNSEETQEAAERSTSTPDNGETQEIVQLIAPEGVPPDGKFRRLQKMVGERVFDVVCRTLHFGAVVNRKIFESVDVEVRRCAVTDASRFSFMNRVEREMVFSSVRWIEPNKNLLEDFEAEMNRVEEEVWAKVDVLVESEEKMKITTFLENGETQESPFQATVRATYTFVACLKGPVPFEWQIMDMK